MGRPDLTDDPRFTTLAERAAHADVINGIVAEWTSRRTAADVEAACVDADVPVASAYTVADIVSDEQVAARGDLVTVDDPVLGPVRQQAPFPRLVGSPPLVPSGAPRLGEHNREIWCDLVGLSERELADLAADGIV
jgi:crotonobetainyl-CoA:carnitine CoA-transferase CaiB-like acyl-CoA transferase